jgi:hypothetical protein
MPQPILTPSLAPFASRLNYKLSGSWRAISEWAEFYWTLGAHLVSQPRQETRSIAGVVVPTQAYAAVLAAAGAVCANALADAGENSVDYFTRLCSQPNGTPITYLFGKRRLQGLIEGCEEVNGQKRLWIRTSDRTRNERHTVFPRQAHLVELLSGVAPLTLADLPPQQKGVAVKPLADFARALLGDQAALNFALRARLDCLILGRLKRLCEEIQPANFAARLTTDEVCAGKLADVLRVRRLLGANKPFRCDFIPSNTRKLAHTSQVPPLVIFDGAGGFLRWRERWRQSHWLVILEQTAAATDEAVAAFNQEYVQRRLSDDLPANFPAPPPGVELAYYEERLT